MQVVILRGLPGAGKSTYIREHFPGATPFALAPREWSPVVISADHAFTDWGSGTYTHQRDKLADVHDKGHRHLMRALQQRVPVIILDNTHVETWMWAPAAEAAREHGYTVTIVDLFDGGLTDEQLAARNLHGAPAATIAKMRASWQATSPEIAPPVQ